MRAWTRGAWLVGVAVVLGSLLLPAAASAKQKIERQPGGFSAAFRVKGSHGFDLAVIATGHKRITLIASKGQVSSEYTVPGRASRKGIEADFGELGRVSVRFDATRAEGKEKSDASCKGRRGSFGEGTFRGSIEFAGEGGFTEVDTRQAKGGFARYFRQVCKRESWKPDFDFSQQPRASKASFFLTSLIAESKLGGRSTGLSIMTLEASPGSKRALSTLLSFVSASLSERVGPMTIRRTAFTSGGKSSLLVSKPGSHPLLATIALPKPFSGTATYREDAGAPPSWTGSLGVWLPGAETVPLTGEDFKSGLCRAPDTKAFTACLRRMAKSFGGLKGRGVLLARQGSGSQSQAFWDVRLSWSR